MSLLLLLNTPAVTFAFVAGAGSYAITGVQATLTYTTPNNNVLAANAGSYTVTGAPATLIATRKMVADPGSYAITGANATLLASRKLAADANSYAITGFPATMLAPRWPAPEQVAQGVAFGPTGSEYTGTATSGAGSGTVVMAANTGAKFRLIGGRFLIRI